MTARFVRSGGNAGAWTGTVANLTLGLAAPTAAGDDIYVAADHTEPVSATAITYTSLGTVSLPATFTLLITPWLWLVVFPLHLL
jgi:hypothetical protein